MLGLAIGVVVTVLGAWLLPRWAVANGTIFRDGKLRWPITPPQGWPQAPNAVRWYGSSTMRRIHHVWSSENPEFIEDGPPSQGNKSVIEVQSGWPMMACAFYSACEFRGGHISDVELGPLRSGLPVPVRLQSNKWRGEERWPLVPLWPGFAFNTLCYAAFPYAAMFGVSALKRRRRIRRGLCVACAYPISGFDVCPECGNAHPAASGLHALDRQTLSLPMSQSDGDEPDGTSA